MDHSHHSFSIRCIHAGLSNGAPSLSLCQTALLTKLAPNIIKRSKWGVSNQVNAIFLVWDLPVQAVEGVAATTTPSTPPTRCSLLYCSVSKTCEASGIMTGVWGEITFILTLPHQQLSVLVLPWGLCLVSGFLPHKMPCYKTAIFALVVRVLSSLFLHWFPTYIELKLWKSPVFASNKATRPSLS